MLCPNVLQIKVDESIVYSNEIQSIQIESSKLAFEIKMLPPFSLN